VASAAAAQEEASLVATKETLSCLSPRGRPTVACADFWLKCLLCCLPLRPPTMLDLLPIHQQTCLFVLLQPQRQRGQIWPAAGHFSSSIQLFIYIQLNSYTTHKALRVEVRVALVTVTPKGNNAPVVDLARVILLHNS